MTDERFIGRLRRGAGQMLQQWAASVMPARNEFDLPLAREGRTATENAAFGPTLDDPSAKSTRVGPPAHWLELVRRGAPDLLRQARVEVNHHREAHPLFECDSAVPPPVPGYTDRVVSPRNKVDMKHGGRTDARPESKPNAPAQRDRSAPEAGAERGQTNSRSTFTAAQVESPVNQRQARAADAEPCGAPTRDAQARPPSQPVASEWRDASKRSPHMSEADAVLSVHRTVAQRPASLQAPVPDSAIQRMPGVPSFYDPTEASAPTNDPQASRGLWPELPHHAIAQLPERRDVRRGEQQSQGEVNEAMHPSRPRDRGQGRWPDLLGEPSSSVDEGSAALRTLEHARKLDLEQRGGD